MPDFSIPLSGLTPESTALSAIANNLSNQNTTGYKDTSVLFSDLFYQNLGTTGSGDPIQVGAGVEIGVMPSLFTQGSIRPRVCLRTWPFKGADFSPCRTPTAPPTTRGRAISPSTAIIIW